MVCREGTRADEPLLLPAPVADDDRSFGVRIDFLENAHRLEHRERTGAELKRPAGVAHPNVPGVALTRAERVHPFEGAWRRITTPLRVGATGGFGEGHEYELSLGIRKPLLECTGIPHLRKNHDGSRHILAACARAPGEHRSLERADPRCHEIDVRRTTTPSLPRTILLVPRGDSPFAVARQQPIVARFLLRRAGEPRTHGVEERLGELPGPRAVHADSPDAAKHGVVS